MKVPTLIKCLIASIFAVSCTKTPDCREFLVPEIVCISSLPEIHDAVLFSNLKEVPSGKPEVGFYIGKSKTELKRISAALNGKTFSLTVKELGSGETYWFKAYVSNGRNEIASGFECFVTEEEPVAPDDPQDPDIPDTPEDPDQPDVPPGPDNPDQPDTPIEPNTPGEPDEPDTPGEPKEPDGPGEPEEPDGPDEPEPDTPQEPEEPSQPEEPVEFAVEITKVSATYSDDILELRADVNGDVKLIKECWFMVGLSPENMSRIQGTVENNAVQAYLMGLEEGNYWYKAFITDGRETKESETCQIKISRN